MHIKRFKALCGFYAIENKLLFIIYIARDNNYWIVTKSVQNSRIKSIKMYSLFSENSKHKDHQSPVMFQDLPSKPIVVSKYFFQVFRLEIQTFQNI